MPIRTEPLIEALVVICEDRNLKVAITESLKAGVLVGASTATAGLIFGPIGFALGATAGGFIAALSSKNNFKPAAVIIREMPRMQQELLQRKIKDAFRDFGIQDVAAIAMFIMSNSSFQDIAIKEVTKFLREEMSLNMVK